MTKRMLMLSVAGAALLSGSAFAQTTPPTLTISTATSKAVATATACANSTPCDVVIGSSGSITINAASAAMTVNSNNSFTNEGTISNTKTTGAIGLQIDTGFTNTTGSTTTAGSGIEDLGTIDLSGTGTGKTAIELVATAATTANPTPSETYTGNITLLGSTITVGGDGSTGVLIGAGTTLVGNMDLGGTISLSPTTTTETDNVGINAIRIDGAVQGNVTLDGATITARGNGAQGFLLDGSITGSLVNTGSVQTIGIGTTQNPQTGQITGPTNSGDPEGGSAMLIGGSVTAGFLNSGPVNASDTSNPTALLDTEGNSPALRIDPSLQGQNPTNALLGQPTAAITLGVFTDTNDPGYSFYNRGTIESVPIDPNINTSAMVITGAQGFTTTLNGLGIFNSGTIRALGTTDTKSTQAIGIVGLEIENYTTIGDSTAAAGLCGTITMTAGLCNSNENGGGVISAAAQGVLGSTAIAINIGTSGDTTEKLATLVNLGTISATSTTTEPNIATSIAAYGIIDNSGSLSNITNLGTISASTTTLENNLQTHVALDLIANTTGITLSNQGTIIGDVFLGTGNDSVDVGGTSLKGASLVGNIAFNQSAPNGNDSLFVDSYGLVSGSITEGSAGILDVHVAQLGTLIVGNTTQSLTVRDFNIDDNATALNLAVSSQLVNVANQNLPVVQASDMIHIGNNVPFSVSYSSYIPSAGNFILLQAPIGALNISSAELNVINTDVGEKVPFLFTSQSGVCGYNLPGITACTGTAPDFAQLVLQLVPKTSAQLGLTGYAAQLFPYANAALSTDATLGAGLVNSTTSNPAAETNYSAFAPDASGGTRAVAVSLTDQATGPVAARQRALRMYGTQPGDDTLWGQEFTEFLNDKGNNDLPGYQNRGFGFAVGGDVGDPSDGWYGGAFTFYTGGITQQAPMDTHTDTLWYMLTGYTDWRGKGLFLDTSLDVGYGTLSGHRFVNFTNALNGATFITREADSKRGSELVAGGFTTGVFLVYGGTTILPQLSVDGMALREEGYNEANGGPGLDLTVQPYYANSARAYLGTTVRQDIDFGDFYLQPEARLGYRYDFVASPVKLRTDFQSVQGQDTPTTGIFNVIGPDPERGNLVAGATVSTTTGTWSIGLNYDFVRGDGGSTSQVGTISILGRI